MTQPRFPWALLVILGMFAFIAFSSKPPWLIVGGGIAAALVGVAAIYQLIPRPDVSADWEKKPAAEIDEADPLEP